MEDLGQELLMRNLDDIKRDIRVLRGEIHRLNSWKSKVVGGSIVLSAICSGVMTLILHFLK